MPYYWLKQAAAARGAISRGPSLPEGVSFFTGQRIRSRIEGALRVTSDESALAGGEWKGELLETETAPIVSERFLRLLKSAGADNFEAFPVTFEAPASKDSYRLAREIAFKSFEIHNYMSAVGDEPGPGA